MATLADARARWVAENPVASINPPLSQAGYNALADERAVIMLEQMTQDEARSAAKALSDTIKQFHADAASARTLLAKTVTAGNATQLLTETRTITLGLVNYLEQLVTYLDQRGVL